MLWSFVTAAALSALSTWTLIRIGGLSTAVPNARSSHTKPTPRGGGLAFPATLTLIVPLATAVGWYPITPDGPRLTVLMLLALACAVIGLVDDVRGLPVRPRLLTEVGVALILCAAGMRWTALDLGFVAVPLPLPLSVALTVIWVVWVVNLYNFMDGVNGIASLVGVAAAAGLAALALDAGDPALATVLAVVGGALAGFLPFNFPRARVFMGDAGSLFLGFIFAAAPLALHTSSRRTSTFDAVLLLAPFVLDATLTLLRRLAKRENVAEAHRTHAYQRLADLAGGHAAPTLIYAAITAGCAALVYAGGPALAPAGWLGIAALAGAYALIQRAHARRR